MFECSSCFGLCCCCFREDDVIAIVDGANVVKANDVDEDVTGGPVNEDKVGAVLLFVSCVLLLLGPFEMTLFCGPSGGNGVVIFIPPIIKLFM